MLPASGTLMRGGEWDRARRVEKKIYCSREKDDSDLDGCAHGRAPHPALTELARADVSSIWYSSSFCKLDVEQHCTWKFMGPLV